MRNQLSTLCSYINNHVPTAPHLTANSNTYTLLSDGIIFAKLINTFKPATFNDIDLIWNGNLYNEDKIRIAKIYEFCKSYGYKSSNFIPFDIKNSNKLGILQLGFFLVKISLKIRIKNYGVNKYSYLLSEREYILPINKLSIEDIVLKWVNFHLNRIRTDNSELVRKIKKIPHKIATLEPDCTTYTAISLLIHSIRPSIHDSFAVEKLEQLNSKLRAIFLSNVTKKLNLIYFLSPNSILKEEKNSLITFLAELMINYPFKDSEQDKLFNLSQFKMFELDKKYKNQILSLVNLISHLQNVDIENSYEYKEKEHNENKKTFKAYMQCIVNFTNPKNLKSVKKKIDICTRLHLEEEARLRIGTIKKEMANLQIVKGSLDRIDSSKQILKIKEPSTSFFEKILDYICN